jgi:hypothetical protein
MPRSRASITDANPTEEVPAPPKTKAELRQEALNGVLQVGQLACLTFGQMADAGAIGLHGPALVNETVKLAENNSKIASKVDLLIEVGPYAGIVAAALPFLAQLFVNHGIVKAEMFANAGVVHPDDLERQMKMTLMRQAMETQQEQMRMQEEMEEMRRQFDEAQENASNNGYGEYNADNVE